MATKDEYIALMRKGLAPEPKKGENDKEPFGEGEQKRSEPYNDAFDQKLATKDRVEPSRPNAGGSKGANKLSYNETDPHYYAGDYRGPKGNEQWKQLGKSIVNTPWGKQETEFMLQLEGTPFAKALVNTPAGPRIVDTLIHKADGLTAAPSPAGEDMDDETMKSLNPQDFMKALTKGMKYDDEDMKDKKEDKACKGMGGEVIEDEEEEEVLDKSYNLSLNAVTPDNAPSLIKSIGTMHNATDAMIAAGHSNMSTGYINAPTARPTWSMDPSMDVLAGHEALGNITPQQTPNADYNVVMSQYNPQQRPDDGFAFWSGSDPHSHQPAADPRGETPNFLQERMRGNDGFWAHEG